MNKKIFMYVFMLMVVLMGTVAFTSCGGSDDDPDPTTSTSDSDPTPSTSIVGTWYWLADHECVVLNFDANGAGYIRDTEDLNNYTVRESDKFTYTIVGNGISLYFPSSGRNKNVTYNLSSDGKSLTVYGLDDNDMAIVTFIKK